MGVKAKEVHGVVRDAVSDVGGVTELGKALKSMADLELRNKANEETISKLENEVVSLKSKMEMQAVNIVGGFGCVVKVKDDEIRKLENENKGLWQTISMLIDQLADQQVHTVTQAYRKNTPLDCRDVGASHCEGGSGFDVTVVHDVTPIRVGVNAGVSVENVTVHTVFDSSPVPKRSVGDVNLTDFEVGLFLNKGEGVRNSFVRNLKNKVRKELRLKDYEYQVVGDQEKKAVTHGCKCVVMGKSIVKDTVVDVDTVGVAASKWSGFELNNRFGVWKMLTFDEKEKIMKAYERNGDGAVMWASGESGVAVYFTDVKSLVRGESICGNVIDAYAETLVTEQAHVCAGDALADKSYFFSSICMKERVSSVMKRSLRADGIDEVSIAETFNHPLEAVEDCPQQKADSLDCAVIVCAVMRQYVHHVDVARSLQGTNGIVLRANMEFHLKMVKRAMQHTSAISSSSVSCSDTDKGSRHNSVVPSSASLSTRHGLSSTNAALLPSLRSSNNDLSKRDIGMSSAHCAEESSSRCELVKNYAQPSDQKTLKVQINVGSDNLSTQKNAEIYTGLGLDILPSSSLNESPTDSEGFSHEPLDAPDESPTSILQVSHVLVSV
ncbi:hypothetical protein LOK49_LG14G02035 [Camellia lanceoleosa]|uniref:Uncharacterized protein n=1 Tax=Camellia lanceoleosa TaxID=1840588 RepID=A0ACC0F8B3_9ERIC|nr:hypothetical protein LOK49_LG14G02035 [Camellia lanceoleosa]